MKYMIAIAPDGTIEKREVTKSGELSREDVRQVVGEDYSVVRTYISDMVMLLYGDNVEPNEMATDMLSVTDENTVQGHALIAREVRGKIAGMSYERAEYWIRQLQQ